ncbi:MAG: GrxA family glutaredoxin [Cobetia sp.]|jgi:glutaredoxin 1|uniref:GrxA family glutaredoxin n=1 Tax=Cobetia amphilecti TaxID=1055104 RepID=A0AAP4TY07_9GAMM|nr:MULTISPECIES: GrxA family glutaredoxin [Cobetia]AVV33134.1 GrxA family glutaredoxin [Halomonas sp. SF2003]MBR9753287.1 GrxA family glutaredoxin [Gammaproteobacteria bacterium]NVN55424.1 GrxA family glutaredoxin [bacterium Scap17]KGA01501.1 glutaredoxin [Cobetia amphilecti]KPM76768.1 glutaredoxin [Cobetia sp. UCD-24C]|tara:strand:- start:23 stop:289 length:267 start_codon:yes stop_codon:yes gene_type:complete
MLAVIFGRPGCPFCVRAKDLAEELTAKRDDFDFRYIDIHAEGISKADMEKTIGKPVETVPQIFVDQTHIGGFTEFNQYVQDEALMPQA